MIEAITKERRVNSMGIKTGIGLGVLAAVGVGLGGVGTYMGIMNQPEVTIEGEVSEVDLSLVAGVPPDAERDVVVALASAYGGGNTELIWHVHKEALGQHHDYTGTWEKMSGAVVFNTAEDDDTALNEIRAVELRIFTGGITGHGSPPHRAPSGALNALKGEGDITSDDYVPGWFDVKAHPDAIYTCDDIQPRESAGSAPAEAVEGWTHVMQGQFALNGTKQDLNIAMTASLDGDTLVLEGRFAIDRNDYNVSGEAGDSVIDDLVYIDFKIEAEPGAEQLDGLIAAVAEQTEKNTLLRAEVEQLTRGQLAMQETLANLERELARIAASGGGTGTPAVDVASLPERFTDSFQFIIRNEKEVAGEFEEDGTTPKVEVTFVTQPVSEFDMILVPGDAEKGIAPFYMSETEVAWNRLEYWAYCRDIDTNEAKVLIDQDLRPTPLFGNTEQVKLGFGPLPAIGLSRQTAEAYCKWLSEETGRQYRLPTTEEWELAVELGGGFPADRDELLAQAMLAESAPFSEHLFEGGPAPVGSSQPNTLGIYDLIGNAAEWVTGTGADRVVRGGHFFIKADDMTLDWQSVADESIWNATYPNEPKSEWWYKDHYYQGIRLVCEPVNLPAE